MDCSHAGTGREFPPIGSIAEIVDHPHRFGIADALRPLMRTLLTTTALFTTFASTSFGAITVLLTPAPDGGVNVSVTGSGNTSAALSGQRFLDIQDFDMEFLDAAVGIALINTDTITSAPGFQTTALFNVTQNVFSPVIQFTLDKDSAANSDDIRFTTQGNVPFNAGDEFQLNFEAQFSAAQLLFSNLNPGTFFNASSEEGDDIFGDTTLTVAVPESSTAMLAGLGLIALSRRRR